MSLCRQVCFCYDGAMNFFPSFLSQENLFILASVGSLVSFSILITASFITKSQLSITILPHYILYLYKRLFHDSSKTWNVLGEVIKSSNGKPLSGVTVYALDPHTGYIMSHAITNKKGAFTLKNLNNELYTLSFLKNNYFPLTLQSLSPVLTKHEIKIAMTNKIYHKTIPHFLLYLLLFLLEKGFLGIVLTSFLFCLLIGPSLGWHTILPYLILSSFSVLTCFFHQR